jgi:hypothetical protein
MITASAYDIHVEKLFDRMKRLHAALSGAGIAYRIIGGMAVYLQVSERDPGKARLTRDVDLAVNREELERIASAAVPFGFQFRHVEVRPEHSEPVPGFSEPTRTAEGILVAPVADLVRMRLTSFRLRDQVHIQDMDSVGLITLKIENSLPEALRERLKKVRASE